MVGKGGGAENAWDNVNLVKTAGKKGGKLGSMLTAVNRENSAKQEDLGRGGGRGGGNGKDR